MPPEIKNAKITSTMLGREDHGILTAFVYLDYGGASQGFGGYAFDGYDKATKERYGHRFGMDFIAAVLATVGVETWEKLPGKVCRVRADFGKVYTLGNFLTDTWFDPEELFAKLKEAS